MGVRRLVVANGCNIFQMLLVYLLLSRWIRIPWWECLFVFFDCLFTSLYASISQKPHSRALPNFFFACSLWPSLSPLWRRCDTLPVFWMTSCFRTISTVYSLVARTLQPTLLRRFQSTFAQQEAFEKCWAHPPLRAAAGPFTRCRYCRTPALSHAACASMSTTRPTTTTTTTRDRGTAMAP